MAGSNGGDRAPARGEFGRPVIGQPVVQRVDGGFQVRCPHCYYLLFISSVGTWRAVDADDPAPKLAVKCPYRKGGEGRCGHIAVLTWLPANGGDVTPVTERREATG